ITLMKMDVGLDTGAIIQCQSCDILPEDTGQTLHDRLATMGADILMNAIDDLEHLPVTAQNDRHMTYAKKLLKSEASLDWNSPADVLERQVRAFNPWPVSQTTLFKQTLRIWEAQALPNTGISESNGSLIQCHRQGIDVMTSKGILRLLTVQKAGGKPISVGDFLNAHHPS
ncbi:MAG: methionyl-tRNA formyltransferase, partial [Thiomargarita sp.]|nr:methionyl-tRNA formyltransferase [Thiomargarita sp.]